MPGVALSCLTFVSCLSPGLGDSMLVCVEGQEATAQGEWSLLFDLNGMWLSDEEVVGSVLIQVATSSSLLSLVSEWWTQCLVLC